MNQSIRRRLRRMWIPICRVWRWVVNAVDLLILVRVPVVAVLFGVLAVVYVPQIRELFEISLSGDAGRFEALWAWVFAGGLSVVAWYSARTLFRFRYTTRHYNRRVKRRLGVWNLGQTLFEMKRPGKLPAPSPTLKSRPFRWISASLRAAGTRFPVFRFSGTQ